MKLDEILNELAEAIKLPDTKEEAIAYIKKEPNCLAFVEDMAFRQVVINILVAANIISEEDFNDSVSHFKALFLDKFADELLEKITYYLFEFGYKTNTKYVMSFSYEKYKEMYLDPVANAKIKAAKADLKYNDDQDCDDDEDDFDDWLGNDKKIYQA